jgi:hypothetical protein
LSNNQAPTIHAQKIKHYTYVGNADGWNGSNPNLLKICSNVPSINFVRFETGRNRVAQGNGLDDRGSILERGEDFLFAIRFRPDLCPLELEALRITDPPSRTPHEISTTKKVTRGSHKEGIVTSLKTQCKWKPLVMLQLIQGQIRLSIHKATG